jgi:response regulator RpfG family c-di-GMP phosphodiesterase
MNGNTEAAAPTANNDAPKKGKLMIVEDDALLLKIFERFFSKHYELMSAKSGNEALELIKQGLKPEVILSDQRMPGLSGDEFLAETMKYLPDAVRVIITAHSDPKEIIAAINRAHTYMFLTKPIEEIELVQAVRLCFNYYSSNIKTKMLFKDLQEKNAEISALTNSPKGVSFDQLLPELNKNIGVFGAYYFKELNEICYPIIKSFTEFLKSNKSTIDSIFNVYHTFIFGMSFMPVKYIYYSPEELSEEDLIQYLMHFNSIFGKLGCLDGMGYFARAASQVWENIDGTGFPSNISGASITMESQIVKIAMLYANSVYRVPKELYENRTLIKDFKQPLAITTHRHKSATKIIFDRAKWLDGSLFNHFRFILQDTSSEVFNLERRDCAIPNRDFDPIATQKAQAALNTEAENSADEANQKAGERKVRISELQPGMLVAQNVITKSGILVTRQDTPLTPQLIKNIQHLDTTGQLNLKGFIEVLT